MQPAMQYARNFRVQNGNILFQWKPEAQSFGKLRLYKFES